MTAAVVDTPAVVMYWSKFLRDALLDNKASVGDSILDLLHHDPHHQITMSFADIFADNLFLLSKELTSEGITRFEHALTTAIEAKRKVWGGSSSFSIGTDYEPDETLDEALKAAGMTEPAYGFFFPMKRWTRIAPDGSFQVIDR